MGICLCFPWFSHLWSCFIASSTSQDMASLEILPDEVTTDILSRLPADQLVNLRGVCKRWCSLTSTPHFVQLHLEISTPVMYFQTTSFQDIRFTLSSVDWSSKKRKQLIREVQLPVIEFLPLKSDLVFSGSCNGLFIFRRNWVCPLTNYIFNPIRLEIVTITLCLIVGFFFDSLTNKYQLVTYDNVMDDFRFYIVSLGPSLRWRKVGSFPYRPREMFAPSVVNGCLHWMAIGKRGKKNISPPCTHSIMVFSIEHCEFRFLPHPVRVNESCQAHERMHLLAAKGHLYAYGMHAKLLDIWALEDSANWYWVKKFSIHLEQDLKHYPVYDIFRMSDREYLRITQIKLIDVWKDEVLLVGLDEGFFRYHRRLKTITKAQFAHPPSVLKFCDVIAIESTMSLTLLRDLCDSFEGVEEFP
ncbi:uncharacterized protein J3R85_003762 [Psidium guajava]|nr:uncharacterized protein J3R85_003762 [Psidium guajava]